jgi:hypothetical protein
MIVSKGLVNTQGQGLVVDGTKTEKSIRIIPIPDLLLKIWFYNKCWGGEKEIYKKESTYSECLL